MSGDTLPAQLLDRAGRDPGGAAFRHKRLGVWEVGTWAGYAADAAAIGLALTTLGVAAGDRVAIVADNRPEWLVADLAVQGIGAVTLGLFPAAPAAEVSVLLVRSAAKVVVCEDEEQLDKVMGARAGLAALEAVVVIDTRGVRILDDSMVHTWADLLAGGRALDAAAWRAKVQALDPDATATVLCPPGGPEQPETTELTSRDLVAAGVAFRSVVPGTAADEVLSSLPLGHRAERLVSVVQAVAAGYVVSFGEGGDSFPQDLREVQPTLLVGTPRMWERMRSVTEHRLADATPAKRSASRWCFARGRALAARQVAGRAKATDPALRLVCWLLCFRPLRRKLGLARLTTAVSGCGPLDAATLEWFRALGVPVQDADLGPLAVAGAVPA